MIKYIPILICSAVLIYGGIVDWKRREIPDSVPIILIGIGILFGFSPIKSIMGLAVSAMLMLVSAKITKSEIPGGDFKLICSFGFAWGLMELAAVILLAGIGAALYGAIRRFPIRRCIPLCTYVAPAYILIQVITHTIFN